MKKDLKEELIDFLWEINKQSLNTSIIMKSANFIQKLKSINSDPEPDGHRALEDNKAKKKKCHARHEYFMLCTKHPDDNNCGDCGHLR